MVYFCERKFSLRDAWGAAELQKLLSFREAIPKEQLWWTYTTLLGFERAVREHLTAFVQTAHRPTTPRIEPGGTGTAIEEAEPPPTEDEGETLAPTQGADRPRTADDLRDPVPDSRSSESRQVSHDAAVRSVRLVPRRVYAAGALVLVLLAAGGWLFIGGSDDREIVYCSDDDVSKSQRRSVDDFNKRPRHGDAKARLVDDLGQADTADGQRQRYLTRLPSGRCDVVYLDVIYMPEFASKNLLRDMSSYIDGRGGADTFTGDMLKTVTYHGKRWGVPKQLDGGVLYYRSDTEDPPTSWQQVLQRSIPRRGRAPGLRLQLDGYEGLTVVFLELAYAAGAKSIVSEDGKTANLDQDETLAALNFLRQAIKHGAVPQTVTKLGDKGSFDVFSRGRAKFLRSWPFIESRFYPRRRRPTNAAATPLKRDTTPRAGTGSFPCRPGSPKERQWESSAVATW